MKRVLILGQNSDIGKSLAAQYVTADHAVILSSSVAKLVRVGGYWDKFISCIGTMEPIGPFLDAKFPDWAHSTYVNIVQSLQALHTIAENRRERAGVCFFAGAGTNGAVPNYSAYVASKIFLLKMAEQLNAETNLNVFIIGPGFVRTKIHEQTIRAGTRAGEALPKLNRFLETEGTSMQRIFECVEWCFEQGKEVCGGRNFSVVHDPWGTAELRDHLLADPDLYKLRRKA